MLKATLSLGTLLVSLASAASALPGPVVELSRLNGKNGFRINGLASSDQSGWSVSSAGDVNGDGFGDLIVGAPYAVRDGPLYGESYVVFGRASGFAADFDPSELNGETGFTIRGDTTWDLSGFSLTSAGDVNGDGFDDLIVGSPFHDPNNADSGLERAGASSVVFGMPGKFPATISLAALDGTTGFRIGGEAAYDVSGSSVASAGDVNGDGFDDVVIGAPYADTATRSGAVYVVFGKSGEFPADLSLSTLDGLTGFRISGADSHQFGSRVASAGDVNGDGFDDLILGDYAAGYDMILNSGASHVVFGKAGGFAPDMKIPELNGTNGFRLLGEAPYDFSGHSVASAGDVNGDGFGDLVIGAAYADPNGAFSGASYVVFGKAHWAAANISLSTLNGATGFQISGEPSSESGASVAAAGDVNSDGYGDVLIGAVEAAPNGASSGASFVVFGKRTAFGANINLSTLNGANGFRINGESAFDESGWSTAGAVDVNNDCFDDLIIGAPEADPTGLPSSGASYVIFGQPTRVNVRTGKASDDCLGGSEFNDRLDGAGGNDRLRGNRGHDRLAGGPGDDHLFGGIGADTLDGGDGDDKLTGGGGRDLLAGGSGRDVFIFNAVAYSTVGSRTRDQIADFAPGSDQLDLRPIDADPVLAGNQAFTFRGSQAFTATRGELRYAFSGGLTIIMGDVDGDRAPDFEIQLKGIHSLHAMIGGDILL